MKQLYRMRGGGAKWDGTQWISTQIGVSGDYSHLEATALNLLEVHPIGTYLPNMLGWWKGGVVGNLNYTTLVAALREISRENLTSVYKNLFAAAQLRIAHQREFPPGTESAQGHVYFATCIMRAAKQAIETAQRQDVAVKYGRKWLDKVKQDAEVAVLTAMLQGLSITEVEEEVENIRQLDTMIKELEEQ